MTEDSFDVGQHALPVGPACFQHLLHALSYSCHANVRTPAGVKQNSQHLCKRQRSHQCGRDSNTLSGFKGQVQIVPLLEAAFRTILNWFNVPLYYLVHWVQEVVGYEIWQIGVVDGAEG